MANVQLLTLLTIFLLHGCGASINVEAIKLSKGTVEQTVSTINSGTIFAKNQAELAFGTVGRIYKIHYQLSDFVPKGAILAEIENTDLLSIYSEASKEYERAQKLFSEGLISHASIDASKRALDVAKSNLDKTRIIAPFKGQITAMDLKVGEFYQNAVAVGTRPKVNMIDAESRFVKGEIDEVDLSKIEKGQTARIKIPALKNQLFKASVDKVVPFISTAKDQDRTGLIELKLLVDDQHKMKSIPVGASADVEIISLQKDQVLMVPTNYLQGIGKNKYVYKLDPDKKNKMTKAPVEVGIGNYERTEITKGLAPGELVIRPPEGIDDPLKVKIKVEEKVWP